MAGLKLKHVYKFYRSFNKKDKAGVQAVSDFNLEIKDGEFIVFVGPSGCGKSTTLRMIAGLEQISRGEIYIGNTVVNDVLAKDRNIAMVFQNYALYPHMTAYENIAFGLRIKKHKEPVCDSNGNKMLVVDKKQIKQLKYEINLLKSTYYLDENIQKNLKAIKNLRENPSIITKDKKGHECRLIDEKAIKLLELEIKKLVSSYKTNGNKVCDDAIKEKEATIKNLLANPSLEKTKEVGLPKKVIDSKVNNVAKILGIEKLLQRKPKEMSGGQRQRVALARAMVRQPEVFLLDEPLSNLDAKLRVSMRSEITKIHHDLKTTFIYVTHDQVEAMTMGDRIVVMKDGVIQQVDTPTRLFDFPENIFVAGFIGTPQMNFFDVEIQCNKDIISFMFENNFTFEYKSNELREINKDYLDGEKHSVVLGIRGENILPFNNGLVFHVRDIENLGNETQLLLTGLNEKLVNVKTAYRIDSHIGDEVSIGFEPRNIHLFDKETGLSIMKDEAVNINKKDSNKF